MYSLRAVFSFHCMSVVSHDSSGFFKADLDWLNFVILGHIKSLLLSIIYYASFSYLASPSDLIYLSFCKFLSPFAFLLWAVLSDILHMNVSMMRDIVIYTPISIPVDFLFAQQYLLTKNSMLWSSMASPPSHNSNAQVTKYLFFSSPIHSSEVFRVWFIFYIFAFESRSLFSLLTVYFLFNLGLSVYRDKITVTGYKHSRSGRLYPKTSCQQQWACYWDLFTGLSELANTNSSLVRQVTCSYEC